MKRGNTEPMRLGENKDERLVEAWLSDLIGQVEREEELRLEAAAKIRAVVDSLVSITEFRGETSGGKFAIMPLSRYEALSVRVEPLQQQIQIVDDELDKNVKLQNLTGKVRLYQIGRASCRERV